MKLSNENLELTPSQNIELLRIKTEIESQNKKQRALDFNRTKKLCEEMGIGYIGE